jgi:hypothetical protein
MRLHRQPAPQDWVRAAASAALAVSDVPLTRHEAASSAIYGAAR